MMRSGARKSKIPEKFAPAHAGAGELAARRTHTSARKETMNQRANQPMNESTNESTKRAFSSMFARASRTRHNCLAIKYLRPSPQGPLGNMGAEEFAKECALFRVCRKHTPAPRRVYDDEAFPAMFGTNSRSPMTDGTVTPAQHAKRSLSAAEVADRVRKGLVNRPSQSHAAEYRAIFARNLLTLFNALVVPAAIALFLLHDYRAAIAVSGLAVVNSLMGLIQELRAKRHLDRLEILAEPKARVMRDGQVTVIPSSEIVQDDHLLLQAGEPVLADGPVLTADGLEIDEALLTGESDPVLAPVGRNLLSGSFCVAGEGVYRAERVGNTAYAHRTGQEARRYRFLASPLQRIINRIIQILTVTAVVMCLLYVALYFVRGFSTKDLVEMIAATITSMVPQGLVLFTTLAFILGAVRMSRRGAVVQRLSAVEAMAAIDVLCMDKTGTLTTNQLCLETVRLVSTVATEIEVCELLALFAQESPDQQNKTIQAIHKRFVGQDSNLVRFGTRSESCPTIVDRLPFKSQNRYSAVHFRTEQNEEFTLVLGAVEALEPFFAAEAGRDWDHMWRELLPSGMRLLMFARADGPIAKFEGRLPALQLRLLALLGFRDELRPDAAEVLRGLASQAIRFKIISGDHPETIRAAVSRLGLAETSIDMTTGAELVAATVLRQLAEQRTIFARVTPQQKLEIIHVLQQDGHCVGMIGDGINDILAVKRADLGIAMGAGSAATRTVAGLVLENNRFELLPAVLQEGRNILRILRRAAKLFLLKNVYTLILILVGLGLLRLHFPYLPQQVTLLNVLTIGIPVLILTLNRQPNGSRGHVGFLASVGWFALTTGTLIGMASLAIFAYSAIALHDPVTMQRTMLLATLVVLGLGNLPRVLTDDGEPASSGDRRLLGWIPCAALLFAFAMYWPPAAYFFELEPLRLDRWLMVLAAAVSSLLLALATDWLKKRVWKYHSPA
jgi:cation-transporting P-type ATPase E